MAARRNSSEAPLCIGLIGAQEAGKSSLVRRFLDDVFEETYVPTKAVAARAKMRDLRHSVRIFDSSGCSRHRRIVRATLKSVKAILVCFRSSGISRDSKRLPRAWVQEADQCSSAAMKILVACGCDEALPSDLLAARKYATQSGLPLFETSSKQCINVTETFVATVNSLMKGGKKAISIQYPNFAEAPSSPRVQTLAERLAGNKQRMLARLGGRSPPTKSQDSPGSEAMSSDLHDLLEDTFSKTEMMLAEITKPSRIAGLPADRKAPKTPNPNLDSQLSETEKMLVEIASPEHQKNTKSSPRRSISSIPKPSSRSPRAKLLPRRTDSKDSRSPKSTPDDSPEIFTIEQLAKSAPNLAPMPKDTFKSMPNLLESIKEESEDLLGASHHPRSASDDFPGASNQLKPKVPDVERPRTRNGNSGRRKYNVGTMGGGLPLNIVSGMKGYPGSREAKEIRKSWKPGDKIEMYSIVFSAWQPAHIMKKYCTVPGHYTLRIKTEGGFVTDLPRDDPGLRPAPDDTKDDMAKRVAWKKNDVVEVYSSTRCGWAEAVIDGIQDEDGEEWLRIRYQDGGGVKEVPRLDSQHIRCCAADSLPHSETVIRPISRGKSGNKFVMDDRDRPTTPSWNFDPMLEGLVNASRADRPISAHGASPTSIGVGSRSGIGSRSAGSRSGVASRSGLSSRGARFSELSSPRSVAEEEADNLRTRIEDILTHVEGIGQRILKETKESQHRAHSSTSTSRASLSSSPSDFGSDTASAAAAAAGDAAAVAREIQEKLQVDLKQKDERLSTLSQQLEDMKKYINSLAKSAEEAKKATAAAEVRAGEAEARAMAAEKALKEARTEGAKTPQKKSKSPGRSKLWKRAKGVFDRAKSALKISAAKQGSKTTSKPKITAKPTSRSSAKPKIPRARSTPSAIPSKIPSRIPERKKRHSVINSKTRSGRLSLLQSRGVKKGRSPSSKKRAGSASSKRPVDRLASSQKLELESLTQTRRKKAGDRLASTKRSTDRLASSQKMDRDALAQIRRRSLQRSASSRYLK